MPRPTREQAPDQRVDRLLVALDEIAPGSLVATLGTAERQLVERLVESGGRWRRAS